MFRGKGEWLGQLAQFEKFGDEKGSPVPAAAAGETAAKGARRVYRPLKTMAKMSKARSRCGPVCSQARFRLFHAARASRPVPNGPGAQMGANRGPSTSWMAGKSFTLRYDTAPAMEYRVDDADSLNWRREGESGWTKARYQAWESAPGLILFGHLLEGAPNHDGHRTGGCGFSAGALVTCFLNGFLNTPYFANEAGVKILFGAVEMEGLIPPKYNRHHFTEDMIGRAVSQNYAPGLTFDAPLHHATFSFVDYFHGCRCRRAGVERAGGVCEDSGRAVLHVLAGGGVQRHARHYPGQLAHDARRGSGVQLRPERVEHERGGGA